MGEKAKKTLVFTDTDSGGIIHVANIKGGVGKSTVATNLAATLSKRGPTLVIDLDVQGSATVALGHDTEHVVKSSWELFRKRFFTFQSRNKESSIRKARDSLRSVAIKLLRKESVNGVSSSPIVNVHPGLDLIPAGTDLFKTPSRFQLENIICNIKDLRNCYKYIVLDTPSVWNALTKCLYLHSDLNLIPVTLNALSTKSLRDYLSNVRALSEHNPSLRIRIVKNEVFGKQDSKLKGKTRTMSENRKYLENLCEQVSFQSGSGVSLLPQSIMFDLEIPESAIVRDAQDEGKALHHFHQHCAISKAFEELGKRVQYVLNTPVHQSTCSGFNVIEIAPKLLSAAVLVAAFSLNSPVSDLKAPRPLAPQQLVKPDGSTFDHTFGDGESIYKMAKYAICRFRAKVPSMQEINQYAKEVIDVHNLTRLENEPKINHINSIPKGLTVTFYPPEKIRNPEEKQLVPVYRFFTEMVDDGYAYITGDWCERGTGGGQPHYGIDVACKYGAKVISPIDGEVVLKTNATLGNCIGIVNNGMIIFFAHLDKRNFKEGSEVKKGEVIGTVGMTGRTSGPHAHIGYGIRTQTGSDINFGRQRFRVTDPKLFFYHQMYLAKMQENDENRLVKTEKSNRN